ncbi:acyl-CoA desaturase [Bernardetia sp. MNP-M8]|uniref:fatty acid desaturase family protein n=1 Tax=Bernardetia sp. MNP-M8 TaxID=3127470 RepID=UPI0030D00B0D
MENLITEKAIQKTADNRQSKNTFKEKPLATKKPPRFDNQEQRDFSKTLNMRVNSYFKDNNISRNANTKMVLKSLFHATLWIGSYCMLIFGGFSVEINYLLWAILGFSIAMVSVNIAHDAIHGAYSKHKWVNDLLSHTFNFNGASAYMWNRMHNQAHHTYTNIDGHDEDIAPVPIVRLSSEAPLWSIHRYQHIYSFALYCLSTLSWVLMKDYKKFFANEVGNYTGAKHPKKEYFLLFFYKFINYTLFIIIPLIMLPHGWVNTVLGFLLMHAVSGFFLAVIFMLAHVVEEAHFFLPNEEGNMENSWAVHQLYTTANFSEKSEFMAFITGGLNQQVEHHLFPNICSIHYPALSKIVKQTAAEYGHPYLTADFPTAVASHVRFLKKMGREERPIMH